MASPSHTYEFGCLEALRLVGRLAFGVLVAAAALHALDRLELLPSPIPADLDRTILRAKARLAVEGAASSTVLVGDSSCLMDVDAPLLTRLLARGSVLNLGTLSYLDLAAHGELLARFAQRHAGAGPDTVIVLLHPEALRWGTPREELTSYLRNRLESLRPRRGTSAPRNPIDALLGGTILRERLVQPFVPLPLPGAYGPRYGCNTDLAKVLEKRQGSLTDPERFNPDQLRGNAEYWLGKSIETACREFVRHRPRGSRLVVGITPVPEGFAATGHDANIRVMLERWARWMGADLVLTQLPARLPDALFATHTHLNAEGAELFTRQLAAQLEAQPLAK